VIEHVRHQATRPDDPPALRQERSELSGTKVLEGAARVTQVDRRVGEGERSDVHVLQQPTTHGPDDIADPGGPAEPFECLAAVGNARYVVELA
jgi:hypothetical protein